MNLLDALFESEDCNIRVIAAGDKKAPIDRLMACINDTNQAVRFAALSNTILPIKVVIDYIKSNVWDESAIEAFCSRIDASTEEIWNLYTELTSGSKYKIASHTRDAVVQCRIIMSDEKSFSQTAVSTSELITDNCASLILKSCDWQLIENVARNVHVSSKILEEAASMSTEMHFTDEAVIRILLNPKCTMKALATIIRTSQSDCVIREARAEFEKFLTGKRKCETT